MPEVLRANDDALCQDIRPARVGGEWFLGGGLGVCVEVIAGLLPDPVLRSLALSGLYCNAVAKGDNDTHSFIKYIFLSII